MIWHYTNAQGLLGILGSRTLWASSADYLNDFSELHFGRTAFIAALDRVVKQLGGSTDEHGKPLRGWGLWVTAEHMRERFSPESVPRLPGAFVTSFCSDGDLLSQWRGYSGGAGFSIAFDEGLLASIKGAGSQLVPVVYGDEAIAVFADKIWAHLDGDDDLTVENLGDLLKHVSEFKHDSFKEEKEVRLRVQSSEAQEVRVRAQGDRLIPYVVLPFKDEAVVEIRVGPGLDQRTQASALRHFIKASGYGHEITVSGSVAPFRN